MKLSIYTNIPTPYQDDFFKELDKVLEVLVVYYSTTESDRHWSWNKFDYKVKWINNWKILDFVRKKYKDFHFGFCIIPTAIQEKSNFIILSGNYFCLNNLFALLILKTRGKSVYFMSERIILQKGFVGFVKKQIVKLLFWPYNGMLYVGNCAKSSFESFGIKKKYEIIPYNINIAKFNENQNIIKDHSGDNSFRILTSGSLIYRKGMDLAIRSFQVFRDELNVDCELHILGEGHLRDELLQMVRPGDNIFFHGFVQPNAIVELYLESDLFLFCSRYDGWGLVINEAIAAGLPVITSDQVGASEWILNGFNGFLCKSDIIDDYVKYLILLYKDKALRNTLRTNQLDFGRTTTSSFFANTLVKHFEQNI